MIKRLSFFLAFLINYSSRGCGFFKQGIPNYKDFCLQINIPKQNYWNLSFGLTESCQKVPKFDFQSQFSVSKIIRILIIFLLKNTNLEAHFLLLGDVFLWGAFLEGALLKGAFLEGCGFRVVRKNRRARKCMPFFAAGKGQLIL